VSIAILVLAAGRSSRMAPRNKLLLRDRSGVAMVAHVVAAGATACAATRGTGPLIVVTGHQAALVEDAVLSGTAKTVRFVHAADYAAGLSASLRAGVDALPSSVDGVLVCLGDMPLVSPALIARVIGAFEPACGRAVVVPVWQGRRGNPVLWGRRFFPELCALTGDAGARRLLTLHAASVAEIEADGPGVLADFDAPADLAAWPSMAASAFA
jgi:molybdenum cofactor cytidylyltransferase